MATDPGYNAVPLLAPHNGSSKVEMTRMEMKDDKLKRQIRYLRLFQRIASLILSITLTVIMGLTLGKYYTTRNTRVDGQSPWPPRTILWPTILLFIIAASSFLLYSGIMLSYCIGGYRSANTASTVASIFTVSFGIMKAAAWLVTAVVFKTFGSKDRAIKGWSCGGSDNLPEAVNAVVNFNLICQSSIGSFHLTYASSIVEAFAVVVWIWMLRRYMSRRAILRARENQERPAF